MIISKKYRKNTLKCLLIYILLGYLLGIIISSTKIDLVPKNCNDDYLRVKTLNQIKKAKDILIDILEN